MRNVFCLVVLLFAGPAVLVAQEVPSGAGTPTPQAEAKAQTVPPYVQALRVGLKEAQNKNCDKAITILQPLIEATDTFARITELARNSILRNTYLCAEKTENYPLQYSISKMLIPFLEDPMPLWQHRFNLAVFYKESGEALGAFRTLYENDPKRLSNTSISTYYNFLALLDKAGREAERLEVLEDLHKAQYAPWEPIKTADGLTYQLAIALNDAGRQDDALALVDELKGAGNLLTLMMDNRYQALGSYLVKTGRADLVKEARNDLDRAQKTALDNPDYLEAVLRQAQAFRALGQPGPALSVIGKALQRQKSNPDSFKDSKKYLPWLLNEQAYAYYETGRIEQGHEALKAAANLNEEGGSNVSQTINRAANLIAYDKPAKALAMMTSMPTDAASKFGLMWVYANRVCAQAFMDGQPINMLDMLYLRTNKKDNLPALQIALLCANRQQEAAALYIERLQDPDTRTAALKALQRYDPPTNPSAYQTAMRQRLSTIRQRQDLKKQIKKVGKILRIHLTSTYWGES